MKEPIAHLSGAELKLIASLAVKKYREQHNLFVAEGEKVAGDLFPHFSLRYVVGTSPEALLAFRATYPSLPLSLCRIATVPEMRRLSALETPRSLLAVYVIPPAVHPTQSRAPLALALDSIQNAGNLGTILRLCDWLGVREVYCSTGCVDLYNPKVVQATAGALGSVTVYTGISLPELLPTLYCRILGTRVDGTPISALQPSLSDESCCVVLGNEGHGISPEVAAVCTHFCSIPPATTTTTESLNVGLCAAIILSHLTGITTSL